MSSNPAVSTPSQARASCATGRVIRPSARISAKSRIRRTSRLATRGVPRARLATSSAAAGSIATFKTLAERETMVCNSSGR